MKIISSILCILLIQSCGPKDIIELFSIIENKIENPKIINTSSPPTITKTIDLNIEEIKSSNQIERLNYDFSSIDNKFLSISNEYKSSVDKLAEYINKNTSNEIEKVRLIHKWITNNISYDTECYFNDNCSSMDAESVFRNKSSVCSGYANLFKLLADKVSLKSYIVSGFAKGYGTLDMNKSNHAWNGVKIDGKWYLIDTTWSAGYINDSKKFTKNPNDGYFLVPPNQFIFDHMPTEDKWQLLSQIVDKNTFLSFPDIEPLFFIQGFELNSHKSKNINIDSSELKLTFKNSKTIPNMMASLTKDGKEIENTFLIEKEDGLVNTLVRFPEKGNYKFLIYSQTQEKDSYNQIINYELNTTKGTDILFPKLYSLNYDYKVISPKDGIIKSGVQEFKIKIKNVKDIVLISPDNNWTKLTRENDGIFYGFVDVKRGTNKISAITDKDNYASTLVEYQVK